MSRAARFHHWTYFQVKPESLCKHNQSILWIYINVVSDRTIDVLLLASCWKPIHDVNCELLQRFPPRVHFSDRLDSQVTSIVVRVKTFCVPPTAQHNVDFTAALAKVCKIERKNVVLNHVSTSIDQEVLL